ncbi:hypothetical protein D3C81_2305030 [compost metagenome]
MRRDLKAGDVIAALVHDIQPLTLRIERHRTRVVATGPDIILVNQFSVCGYRKVCDAVMQTVGDI